MLSVVVALSAGPVSTTRFQFDSSGRILVPVRINGKEHAFVLDTATRQTTVSAGVAATLNREIQESRPGVRKIDDGSPGRHRRSSRLDARSSFLPTSPAMFLSLWRQSAPLV